MANLGFMGMMVDESWGGSGLDTISYCIAMEEVSKVDASAGVIMSVNNSLVCYLLNKYGSEHIKQNISFRLLRVTNWDLFLYLNHNQDLMHQT